MGHDDKYRLLKRYWGYDTFRPMQEAVVDSVATGHDTLALLPTGGGKSLCYQLPALMREGLCLVVTPLVALMKDQVQGLNQRRISAACIESSMSGSAVTDVLYNAIGGGLKFLYVSPERLRQRRFIEHLRRMKLGLIAVDEAHCISQWGYDFRPPYLQIADIRPYHPTVPLVALTATATERVVQDIMARLAMRDGRVFRGSFFRPNLVYTVEHPGAKVPRLLQLAEECGGSGIVYVRSRRRARQLAEQLDANGVSATFYHAGLDAATRDRCQLAWMENRCRVMVATNAFGMGIDKPDVRFVVHVDLPESLEAYFQEAGRAGRDGLTSRAVLMCDASDVDRAAGNLQTDYPPVRYIRNVYRAICNYYKLPMGGGAEARYDFEMEKICTMYNLDMRGFFSACRFLERAGLILLPDSDSVQSTLFIPLKRDELYRFQLNHEVLGNLLQALIRTHSGLFTEATPIDERRVARRCMMEVDDVVAKLVQMHEMHVVDYRPRPMVPQIHFLSARIDENEIMASDLEYRQLQQSAAERLDAVRRYVDNADECRSRQLLRYFGEVDATDCGVCDVCRSWRSQPEDVAAAVRRLLGASAMPAVDVVRMLEGQGLQGVRDEVRRMLDRGEVRLDADGRLHV